MSHPTLFFFSNIPVATFKQREGLSGELILRHLALGCTEGLVLARALRLTAGEGDAASGQLAPLLGRTCRELATVGDGACATHARIGRPGPSDVLRLENPRDFLRNIFGEPLPRIRSRE